MSAGDQESGDKNYNITARFQQYIYNWKVSYSRPLDSHLLPPSFGFSE